MSLKTYNQKRDFEKTNEPEGKLSPSEQQRFVIQRHQASRLHYDLRLEIDGSLKSWAVPKGPSMNPKDKRLAVQTEDHPVKYLHFEGNIPKGNYGAGRMDIWDSGNFTIYDTESQGNLKQQYKKGDLKITLSGHKIKGKFALVKTRIEGRQQHWLLIKKKDVFSTELPYDAENLVPKPISLEGRSLKKLKTDRFVAPMLAETGKKLFSDPNWIYELKWDGYRMVSTVKNGSVALYSRNGISYTSKFKQIADDLSQLPHDVILDGEVVLANAEGLPEFQALQNFNPKTTKGRLVYYVFDLLHLNGLDTISLPLIDRKSLIPEIIKDMDQVEYCDHIESMGLAFYERAIAMGMEGVIAKKSNSTYSSGYRSEDWLKFKDSYTIEALICGYTSSDGRGQLFGSLILGEVKNEKLIYIGNCGSGFNSAEQKRLMTLFKDFEIDSNPFGESIPLKGREAHWMRPSLVCEVKYSATTKNGYLRHPIYKSLREDKMPAPKVSNKTVSNESSTESNRKDTLELNGGIISISNLAKVYWPESGLRKYDLIDYYLKISEVLLPYLIDRPQSLNRHPNGINSEGFYQKDMESVPNFVETIALHSKKSDKEINYMLCQNEASLIYMANIGCIEINPWSSRVDRLDFPDYTVIDLDPSSKNTFEQVLETANVAKRVLDKAGINGYCKTTGKSGLHIYIPLAAKYSYEEARMFTKLLCVLINEKLPNLTSLERAKNKRKDKIYLDYLQNRRSHTLASVYCVRPVPHACVSTPVSWAEIKKGFKMNDFTMATIPNRLKNLGDLFKPILFESTDIEKALLRLNN